ncbi:MAG: hypothetical protein HYZ91_05355 [Candidatus Omnitrophica bacterium]|nr:hypothetical protein [Candidatus Omnitrophota bacterium]
MSPDGSVKPPPEERLLNLIRGKSATAPREPAGPPQSEGATVHLAVPTGRTAFARRVAWPGLAMGVLGMIVCVELICLIVQAVRPLPAVEVPPSPSGSSDEAVTASQPLNMPSLVGSAPQSLFAFPAGSAPASAQVAQPPSEAAKQLVSRLTLTGIVSGNPPQAIIEDTQTRKTYFVTAGQGVVEGAVLDHILENRVILKFQGEQIELTL